MSLAIARVGVPSFLPVPGGRIAYRDVGPRDAPAIVLLHGGAVDGRMWSRQIEASSDRFRVVVPDIRGHGASSTPTAPYRPHDDVAALLEHLGTGPATLAGVSLGARIAGDVALERPDLLAGVVLCGAGLGEPSFTEPWITDVFDRWGQALRALDADGWVAVFLEFAAGPHRRLDDVDPLVLDEIRLMAVDVLAHHLPADPTEPPPAIGFVDDARDRAGSLAVPLLGIDAELDSDDHRRMVADAVAAAPRAERVTIGGAAHYPNMERPAEFTEALLRFVTAQHPVTA